MSKSVINFKVDSEVKDQAQLLARELGVPLSTVINAQLKQFLRERSLAVDATPRMTPYLESILTEVEADRALGRNVTRTVDLEESMAHLDSL